MIPNLFRKYRIPDETPVVMQEVVNELKKLNNRQEVLKRAYEVITTKYHGRRYLLYPLFFNIFITDLEKLWAKSGFLHCTTISYLLRVLLIKSGHFTEDDVKLKHSWVWYISPHQYLRVKVAKDKFINVDTWDCNYGRKFGDYAHGFH